MGGKRDVGRGLILLSGQVAVLEAPDVKLHFMDLLHNLGNQKRYAGTLPVSVLKHLLICALLAEYHFPDQPQICRYAIAHDVHEAYYPDQIRPLKKLLPEIEVHERRWEAYVHEMLHLPWPRPDDVTEAVKHLDNRAVCVEVFTWHHPRMEWFFEVQGPRPDDVERQIGAQVCRMEAVRIYQLLRSRLPSLPAPGAPR